MKTRDRVSQEELEHDRASSECEEHEARERRKDMFDDLDVEACEVCEGQWPATEINEAGVCESCTTIIEESIRAGDKMKTKQMFLSVHREYGQVWWTLTTEKIGALPGHMPVGMIDLPVDEDKVMSDLDAFEKANKAVKLEELLAQIAELDGGEI